MPPQIEPGLISEYYSEIYPECKAQIYIIGKERYIDYTKNNILLYREFFNDKSLRYLEDAAENWALGIKKLDL
jgi:hypothetical protein